MGQFDAFKKRIAGGRNALELPVAVTKKGQTPQLALPMSGAQVSPEEEANRTGGGATADFGGDSGLIVQQIKSDRSKNRVREAVTRNRGKDAVNVAHEEALQDVANEQKQDLLTTSMRERNGEAVDTDETLRPTGPAAPEPDRSVRTAIEKSTGIAQTRAPGNSARLTGFAMGVDPEAAYRDRAYDENREDLLAGEREFNQKMRAEGSTLRSEGGMSYEHPEAGTTSEFLDLRKDVLSATSQKWKPSPEKEKKTDPHKKFSEINAPVETIESVIPESRNANKGTPVGDRPERPGESTGAVRGERATLDKVSGGYNEAVESGAPSSNEDDEIRSGSGKDVVAKESSADASPGEEVDTSVNPETVGLEDHEGGEEDNKENSNDEGKDKKGANWAGAGFTNSAAKNSAPYAPPMSWAYATHHEEEKNPDGTPRMLTRAERQDRLDKALTAYGAKDAWRSAQIAGSNKKGEFDANANAIKPAKDWSEQDLWDEEGNVKPEYDINSDHFDEKGQPVKPGANPLATTTISEYTPTFKSPTHEKMFKARNKALASLNEKHEAERASVPMDASSQHLRGLSIRHMNERAAVEEMHKEPEGGYFNEEGAKAYKDTKTVASPLSVPAEPKEERAGSARNIVNISTATEGDRDRSIEDIENEDEARRASRVNVAGVHQLDQNKLPGAATPGESKEQELIRKGKFQGQINTGVSTGTFVSRNSPEIIERGKRLAKKLDPNVDVNDPMFETGIHAKAAYVMHHAGIAEDKEGTSDYEHLKKFTGTNEANFAANLHEAYQTINEQERFKSGKQTTYSAANGTLNPTTDYFRTKSGEKVSLANTSHPEHPGEELTGSESRFQGFHGDANDPKGIRPTGYGVVGKGSAGGSVEYWHQGWHPYTDEAGHRVFEKHDVTGATHMGDVYKDAIKKGRSFGRMIGSLKRGSKITYRAGQDGPLQSFTSPSPDHQNHVANGINSPTCPACSKTSSANSRANSRDAASAFDPESLDAKIMSHNLAVRAGEAEGPERAPTAESAAIMVNGKIVPKVDSGIKNLNEEGQEVLPKADRSEGRFIDVSTSAGATKARKNLGNAGFSGRPAANTDIDAARAAGHISKSEALELKVSSGSLPSDKSQFKDED
jgi:hypothetical protein